MEQNREPRNKPKYIQSPNFQQRHQEHTMGKELSFQVMVLGKLDIHMQKNETGSLSYTIHKNQFKMN